MIEPRMRHIEGSAMEIQPEVGLDQAASELAIPAAVEAVTDTRPQFLPCTERGTASAQ